MFTKTNRARSQSINSLCYLPAHISRELRSSTFQWTTTGSYFERKEIVPWWITMWEYVIIKTTEVTVLSVTSSRWMVTKTRNLFTVEMVSYISLELTNCIIWLQLSVLPVLLWFPPLIVLSLYQGDGHVGDDDACWARRRSSPSGFKQNQIT